MNTNPEEDTLRALLRFAEHRAPDVQGHASASVPADVRAELRAFASGSLDPGRRQELARALLGQPEMMTALVEEIRRIRPSDAAGGVHAKP
jgi:hypothetical protein